MVELGLTTQALWDLDFEEICKRTSALGLRYLEVSCLPTIRTGKELKGNFNNLTLLQNTDEILRLLTKYGVEISTLTCNINHLVDHPRIRKKHRNYLLNTIEAAKWIGVKQVGTYLGFNNTVTAEENLKLALQELEEAYELAARYNISIIFENWPGEDRSRLVNLAGNSQYWPALFKQFSTEVFGLSFDPSHCMAMNEDYISLIRDHHPWIKNIHIKDRRYDAPEYVIAGTGDIDWRSLLTALDQAEYNGKLMIEIEGTEWNSPDIVFEAIVQVQRYILSLVMNLEGSK